MASEKAKKLQSEIRKQDQRDREMAERGALFTDRPMDEIIDAAVAPLVEALEAYQQHAERAGWNGMVVHAGKKALEGWKK